MSMNSPVSEEKGIPWQKERLMQRYRGMKWPDLSEEPSSKGGDKMRSLRSISGDETKEEETSG